MEQEREPGQEPDYIPKPHTPADSPDDIETDKELQRQQDEEEAAHATKRRN